MCPDEFADGDVTKEAFVHSLLEILWKKGEARRSEEAAMRIELLDLSNRPLKQHAKDEGVAQDKIGTHANSLPVCSIAWNLVQ